MFRRHQKEGVLIKFVTAKTVLMGILFAALVGLTGCGGGEPPSQEVIGPAVESQAANIGPVVLGDENRHAIVLDYTVGEALYSQGWSNIPDGTEVFPVRVNCHVSWQERELNLDFDKTVEENMKARTLVQHEWTGFAELYFWKNSYGEWAHQLKEG